MRKAPRERGLATESKDLTEPDRTYGDRSLAADRSSGLPDPVLGSELIGALIRCGENALV